MLNIRGIRTSDFLIPQRLAKEYKKERTSLLTAVAPSFELEAVTSANSQPVVPVDRLGTAEDTPVEGLSTIY